MRKRAANRMAEKRQKQTSIAGHFALAPGEPTGEFGAHFEWAESQGLTRFSSALLMVSLPLSHPTRSFITAASAGAMGLTRLNRSDLPHAKALPLLRSEFVCHAPQADVDLRPYTGHSRAVLPWPLLNGRPTGAIDRTGAGGAWTGGRRRWLCQQHDHLRLDRRS